MNLDYLVRASVAMIATVACISVQAAPTQGVAVSIATEKAAFGHDEDIVVRVSMTNTSNQPQYVLKYHTPFVNVEESLFEVTRDGEKVPYLGAHYKRPAPTAGDYFLLKPGATHTAKVELTGLYDMSITGDYQIKYVSRSLNLFAAGLERSSMVATASSVGELQSDGLALWVDGRHARGFVAEAKTELTLAPAAAGLAFTNCTASQSSTVTSAINAAKTMANGSVNYLNAGSAGQRYTKWFGSYTSSRYNTVKSHFASIKSAFDTKPVTVDCGCKQSYYAYVYPTQPYKIYVCKAFWSAPMSGTDSKGGTLVHEMSHFNVVAATDDWAYGQSAAASLASSNPSKAVDNADSHEYFGENTPGLN
jgi:peptidyl-Lys metalloendopeptidase